jgi:hypothetical protein
MPRLSKAQDPSTGRRLDCVGQRGHVNGLRRRPGMAALPEWLVNVPREPSHKADFNFGTRASAATVWHPAPDRAHNITASLILYLGMFCSGQVAFRRALGQPLARADSLTGRCRRGADFKRKADLTTSCHGWRESTVSTKRAGECLRNANGSGTRRLFTVSSCLSFRAPDARITSIALSGPKETSSAESGADRRAYVSPEPDLNGLPCDSLPGQAGAPRSSVVSNSPPSRSGSVYTTSSQPYHVRYLGNIRI